MKKRLTTLVLLTLVMVMVLSMFSGFAQAAESVTLKVTKDTYLTSRASTSSKYRIMKVSAGSMVTQLKTGSYYYVQYAGKSGYIKKSYLTSSWGYGVIGSIKIDGTKVDYKVAIGNDNKYYMNKTSAGKKSADGAIFADFRNIDKERRSNLIFYGHNMKKGTMFAALHGYEDAAYFAANPTIDVSLTGDMGFTKGNSKYTVFAQGEFAVDGAINPWRTQFKDDADFKAFVKSIYDYCKANGNNVSATAPAAKEILTLSTCVFPRSTVKRYIVFAYKN